MTSENLDNIITKLQKGELVPYLGSGVLFDVMHKETQTKMAATSDELIIAMNDGPMAPKLMYEFPRAAMNLELKRGRKFITQFLDSYYGDKQWARGSFHDLIASIKPHFVIDINRDSQLQDSYADTPHTLIRGVARVIGSDYRFIIHEYDGTAYQEIDQENMNLDLPILFKPMGSPVPNGTYIASDADYVDYITELMGGFAIPKPLKTYRQGKQYLFLGLRMNRDTERMVLSDIIYSAGTPAAYALIPDANKKEEKFCARNKIEIIDADVTDLMQKINKHVDAA